MIKTVIFDLDGTLIESLTSIMESMNLLLESNGFPVHTADDYKKFVGDGVEKLIERSVPKTENINLAHYVAEFTEIYLKEWEKSTIPFDGINEMLSDLEQAGLNMFILSNKTDELTKIQVSELFPEINFIKVMGAKKEIPKKPDPITAIKMLKENNLTHSEAIFIGDSGIDMETAVRSRMIPGGVLWGFRDMEELNKSGAKVLFDSPHDITRFVLDKGN